MHSFEDFHDVVLVKRVRSGDMAALELLVRRHQRVLYTVAVGMFGDAGRAREALLMSLLSTCGRISTANAALGFSSVAHRLLIDECLSVLRHDPPSPDPAPAAGDVSEDTLARRASTIAACCRRVRAAVLQLLPELRATVVLRHFAGLSHEEMAAALDLPLERVLSRLHAARQQLGERLLGKHVDAPGGAAVLHELGDLLQMLVPVEPPANVVPDVLLLVSMLGIGNVWVNGVIER
jgi:RNA polymerase sigma-70 factor, ECF subfamily